MTEDVIIEKTAKLIEKIGHIVQRSCTVDGIVAGYSPMPDAGLDQAYVSAVRALMFVQEGEYTTKDQLDTLQAEILSAAVLLHKHCVENKVGAFAQAMKRSD